MNLFRRLFPKQILPLARSTVGASSKARGADRSSTAIVDGDEFLLAQSAGELCSAVAKQGRAILRFRSVQYGSLLRDLAQRLQKEYGANSRQYNDLIPSPLLCAGCLWEFPMSYVMSLQAPDMFGDRILGGTPGFDRFGKSGTCPKCGSDESLLVYEYFPTEKITRTDIEAIRKYWQNNAHEWWQSQQRSEAICDRCNGPVSRGGGYLADTDLMCGDCLHRGLMTEGIAHLRNNPHYYGNALLRKARSFRM